MYRCITLLVLCILAINSFAQESDFPYGGVNFNDLSMKQYGKDTSAVAVVLNEYGNSYFNYEQGHNLIFEYHIKIKILKKEALSYANLEIPLQKSGQHYEKLRAFQATSYTLDNAGIKETGVGLKDVLSETYSSRWDLKKIALPNVREGSIVEYRYQIESPFYFNFRPWEFQADIPKMQSLYRAVIPANFLYNITLKGLLPLTTNTSSLNRDCYSVGANVSDCSVFLYGMKDIPAFIEEEYMTAKSNFVSAVVFELSEYRYFDGRVDKITKQWRDAEIELKNHDAFGHQLKKADGRVKDDIEKLVALETDPLQRAKKVYYYITQNFQWNGKFGMFTDAGVKKAFDTKSGNVADINFTLIGALDLAGIEVYPLILSTRDNGVPIDLHPVISDFNYVVAHATISGKSYLLDATDPLHPFGLLPERCLNGKGRLMTGKESSWVDLTAAEKARRISNFSLKINADGLLEGGINLTFMGYEAVKQRKQVYRSEGQKAYIDKLAGQLGGLEIQDYEIKNLEDLEKPFAVKLNINHQAYDDVSNNFLFNPFLIDKEKTNPFKSSERTYPVDFGSPREMTTVFRLEFPDRYEIVNLPEKIALSLPNAGGRFILDSKIESNTLTISNALTINRTVYSPQEYPYLKELYSRIIQAQNEDLIFKKKL